MNAYMKQLEVLGGRSSKKVANNTYIQRRDDKTLALKYHATDVVTYYDDGRVVLNSGGWRTSTTKLRFNESYAKIPIQVWSDRGVWYVAVTVNGFHDSSEPVAYDDGLTLQMNGDGRYHVDMKTVGEDPKATIKLRNKIKRYAAGFIAEMRAGKVSAPSAGDCLYCQLREVGTGKTMGECAKGKSHIESHIAERYYVPSLLLRALEVMPCSQVMKWAVGEIWQPGTEEQTYFSKDDFVWQELTKMLSRYVMRQMGMVS